MEIDMEERINEWSKQYDIEDMKIVGYQGGFPIIQFKKDKSMRITRMSQNEINKIIKSAETYGGIELGVAYNLRKTASVFVYDETIVICGHEFVLKRILEKVI